MKLTSVFLRWVARNSDRLVQFITDLDAEIDKLLLKYNDDVTALEGNIRDVYLDTEALIAAAEEAAEETVADIRDRIDEATKGARILQNIKTGLPTGN